VSNRRIGNTKVIIIIMILILVLSSCQLSRDASEEQQEIELSVWIERWFSPRESIFDFQLSRILKDRFPKLQIHLISSYTRDLKLLKKDLMSNNKYDLIIAHEYTLPMHYRTGMMSPIYSDGVEQLDQIEEFYLDNIRSMDSEHHELYAVPIASELIGLYYSPDRMQSLGLPLPEDGMTWQQLIDYGQSIDIKSIFTNKQIVRHMMSQLGLRLSNPQTNKIDVMNDEWVQFATIVQELFRVPGNVSLTTTALLSHQFNYSVNKYLFEITSLHSSFIRAQISDEVNYDLVSVPVPDSNTEAGVEPLMYAAFIHPDSKKQVEALKVINYLLTPEVQTMLSTSGRGTVLRDEAISIMFGSAIRNFDGKNIAALTKYKIVPSNRLGTYISRDLYDVAENVLIRLIDQSVEQTLEELDRELNQTLRDEELQIELINEVKYGHN